MEPGTQKGSSPGFLGMLQGSVYPRAVCGFWLHLSSFSTFWPDLWGSNRSQLETTSLCSFDGWWRIFVWLWGSDLLCGNWKRPALPTTQNYSRSQIKLCVGHGSLHGEVSERRHYKYFEQIWRHIKNGALISNKHSYSLIHTVFMKFFWDNDMVWIFVSSKIGMLTCSPKVMVLGG